MQHPEHELEHRPHRCDEDIVPKCRDYRTGDVATSQPCYDVASPLTSKFIWYLVKSCDALITQQAEQRFKAHGLSMIQWQVLLQLRSELSTSVTELSRKLSYDIGALSRVVDTLDRRGLLLKKRSHLDRRIVKMSLTPEGRRSMEVGLHTFVALLNTSTQPFSHFEIDQLVTLLQRMVAHLHALADRNSRLARDFDNGGH